MKRSIYLMMIPAIMAIGISLWAKSLYGQDFASWPQTPELAEISDTIQSPEDLSSWLSKNIRYEMKFPDRPQPVADLLASKTGDCDDFANLSSLILSNMNIDNKVIIIKFKGIPMRHAVCAYRNKTGNYNFLSNSEVIYTEQATIQTAIAAVYPDFEEYEESLA